MSYGDYEQARKSFEDAVEIDPEDSMAHYNLAITLTSKLNDHRQALKHARLASKIDTDNPSILHLIANILQSQRGHLMRHRDSFSWLNRLPKKKTLLPIHGNIKVIWHGVIPFR